MRSIPGGGASAETAAVRGSSNGGGGSSVLAMNQVAGRREGPGLGAARCSALRGMKNSGGLVPPAAFCASHDTVVGGCLIHAAQCSGAFSSNGGTIAAQAAS